MNGPEHFDGDDDFQKCACDGMGTCPGCKASPRWARGVPLPIALDARQDTIHQQGKRISATPLDPRRFGAVLPPEPPVLKRATDALEARLADDSPWALVKELERELRQRLAELQALKAPRPLVTLERLEALEALATATRRFIACQVEFPDAPDACTEKFDALLRADEELDRYPT